MHDETDPGVAQLLERALPHRPDDPHRLVTAGISRGRALRRRRTAGTAVAALAVFGVIGGVAAVVPLAHGGGDRTSPVATEPTTTPTVSPSPGRLEPTAITISSRDIPATVEQIVGRQQAGPLRTGAEGPRDTPDEVAAHFGWQGTLASVIVEKVAPNAQQQCDSGAEATGGTCTTNAAGDLQLTWGPSLADLVTAQGVSIWRGDFEVSVLSYNAADGKDVTPLMDQPPLSLDELAAVAGSDAWFDPGYS